MMVCSLRLIHKEGIDLMIARALSIALRQFIHPQMIGLILKVILLIIGGFVGLWILALFLISSIDWGSFSLFGFELVSIAGWLFGLSMVGTTFASLLLSWISFPALATAMMILFADRFIDLAERLYYPQLESPRVADFGSVLMNALSFFITLVGLHIVLFPLYMVMMVFFGSGVLLYLLLNGWLIGREYYEMVAARRLERETMREERRNNRGLILIFGLLFAFMMGLPLIGFLIPVLALLVMTHLFHGKAEHSLKLTAS